MKKLREAIDTGNAPDMIEPGKRAKIEGGELGYEPLMPATDTTHKIASAAYTRAMDKLSTYIPPNKMPRNRDQFIRLLMGMMQTMRRIKEIENNHVEYLEHLAVQTVLNLPEFAAAKAAVEAGNIRIEPTLIRGIIEPGNQQEMENEIEAAEEEAGEEAKDNFEAEMARMMADVDQEKRKRKFANVMIQGAAVSQMYLFEYVRDQLNEVNPSLGDMYGYMNSVGDMAYWVMPEMDMGSQAEAGEEEVEQDEETGEGVIKAQGVIFPILIHEIVKGLVEYLSSHGLPKDPGIAKEVMADTDTPNREVYDIMLGASFWKRLTDAINPEDAKLLYHVWGKIISLPAMDEDIAGSFAEFMKEFLKSPDAAKRIVRSFVIDIKKAIAAYEQSSENESTLPENFRNHFFLSEAIVTNKIKSLMPNYPKLTEADLVKWAEVDPTQNGICVPIILLLAYGDEKQKIAPKIRSPKDITNIINKTTYVPEKVKEEWVPTRAGSRRRVVKVIPLSSDEKAAKIAQNAPMSLPWVLKQIKDGNIRYPEDLDSVSSTLNMFFKFRKTAHWEGNPQDITGFKTFEDLSKLVTPLTVKLFGSQVSKKMDEKPDTEPIGEEAPYELIRIYPTREGQKSLSEYREVGGRLYANWCVGRPDPSGWQYFISTYLHIDRLPGLNNIVSVPRDPPQEVISNPLYSYYMVAKEGLPYALFEFQSNYYMNIHDSEGRSEPDYNNKIRGLIERSIPQAKGIVSPDVSSKPSNLLKNFIAEQPKELASIIVNRLRALGQKTNKKPFDGINDETDAKKFIVSIVESLTMRLRNAFDQKDVSWKAGLEKWGQYAVDKVNIKKNLDNAVSNVMGKQISIDTPEIRQALLDLVLSKEPITSSETENSNLKFEDALAIMLDKMKKEKTPKSPVTEGRLAKLLGTAAVAGSMAFGSPDANAAQKPVSPQTTLTQNNSSKIAQKRIQQNIIARTLWAEGRNGGEKSMRGVASVIHTRGFGNVSRMIEEIKHPRAFSCWNKMSSKDWKKFQIKQKEGPEWLIANKIAAELVNGTFTKTVIADHYYNPTTASPDWAYNNGELRSHLDLGDHRFMKIGSWN